MTSASEASTKWAQRSSAADQDYVKGSQNTTKDQAALAAAAKSIWQAALNAAFQRGSYEKGLSKSGKAGWLAGILQKGASNYQTGVASTVAAQKYTENSGRYDSARNSAASLARGPRGSQANYQRSQAVGQALHTLKVGQ